MRSPFQASFYVAGGTLGMDAPSYVSRQADEELVDRLERREFCYILTARQMGKSSLMVRAADRLRSAGFEVGIIDLTAIGQNVTPEQWYEGVIGLLGRQLDLEDELEEFWEDHASMGPMRRWLAAVEEVLLGQNDRPIVIFVDEVDSIKSLPFVADEFLAGIRECLNRRATNPEFMRITFCLLGVATPSELIRDDRTTPFNVGHRSELFDFSRAEAELLTGGLPGPPGAREFMLKRVLHWTGGHPYLTQRLCQEIAANGGSLDSVDGICRNLFLKPGSVERDTNLLFVRDRLLRPDDEERAALLGLYDRVLRPGSREADDPREALAAALRLAGVVHASGGFLRPRNRIYRTVFDRRWARENIPAPEARRQQIAFRRGFWRATSLALLVGAILTALSVTAIVESRLAKQRESNARNSAYAADMGLAYRAYADGELDRVEELLDRQTPARGQQDLRGVEWGFLSRQCRRHEAWTDHHERAAVRAIAFTPDNRTIVSVHEDGILCFCSAVDGLTWRERAGPSHLIGTAALYRSGQKVLLRGSEGLRVLSTRELRPVGGWMEPSKTQNAALSPLGDHLLVADKDWRYQVDGSQWKVAKCTHASVSQVHAPACLALSPGSDLVAIADVDGVVHVVSAKTGAETARLTGHRSYVRAAAFSCDGRLLATGGDDDTVRLWNPRTGASLAILNGHSNAVRTVAFSADGRWLATGGADGTVCIWDIRGVKQVGLLRSSGRTVTCLAFSSDAGKIVAGDESGSIRLWDLVADDDIPPLDVGSPLESVAFTGSEALLLSGDSRGTLEVYRARTEGDTLRWRAGNAGPVLALSAGSTGPPLAILGEGPSASLRRAETGTIVSHLAVAVGQVSAAAVCGDAVALGSSAGAVRVWETCREPGGQDLPPRGAPIRCLAIDPARKWIAVGSAGSIHTLLWDPGKRSITPVDPPLGRSAFVLRTAAGLSSQSALPNLESTISIAFSPDGARLATGGSTGNIKLFSLAGETSARILGTEDAAVGTVCFSPDGRTLVTGTKGLLRFWSVATAREIGSVTLPGKEACSLAMAPAGGWLAAGLSDGTVRIWPLDGPAAAG